MASRVALKVLIRRSSASVRSHWTGLGQRYARIQCYAGLGRPAHPLIER
jgi:hypothetical protein